MGGFLNQISMPQGQQPGAQAPGAPAGGQPQIVTGPDGQHYVVTAQGYIPYAQWQAQQAPPQQQQQQQPPMNGGFGGAPPANGGFAPPGTNGAPPMNGGFNGGFAPPAGASMNGGFAPPAGNGGFAPPAGGGFAPPAGPPMNGGFNGGFAPPAQQNGFGAPNGFAPPAQGAPVGGFAQNNAPFNGANNPMQAGAAVPFAQFLGGLGGVSGASVARGNWFRGNGSHLCKITKISGGLGAFSQMPFWSADFEVVHSTNAAQNPIGATLSWTTSIDNMKYHKKWQERVKNFTTAVMGSMNPQQPMNDGNVNEQHSEWLRGEQQPGKGFWVWVHTKEDEPKADKPDSKPFTHHSFTLYIPQPGQPGFVAAGQPAR